ncbi:CRISPR-associated Cmr5 family protein [Thermodesulfitimonas autotrophica]|uniref:CRISPR type III-B/RAMP module-associated protein Cmr5 n=1 Tax=Thermodesulfitimonas autotrophica TaxID=1894989 RepID=A0A3N5APH0_9THEO|nr:type III-B CRISPR module-associated protein Cmr5 [Thermodesulfitimonas autotrophica]RPF46999.1 CRISPR-associated Cmr5 family protein [Thermodesulfitimonas autotrophica]
MQTLEQKRAKHALDKVRNIKDNYRGEQQENFVSYVERLPATILTNGLGQAMAMLLAQAKNKEESAHYLLYNALKDWLCRNDPEAPYKGESDLMAAIVSHDRAAYLRAQVEALAYLEWFKKFVVAFLKEKKGKD